MNALYLWLFVLACVLWVGWRFRSVGPECTGDAATCEIDECQICAVRDCPSREPLHYHHDGCPACWTDYERTSGHRRVVHADGECSDKAYGTCTIRELFLCQVCGGFEGSLLPRCPGRQLTEAEHDANYQHYCAEKGPFAKNTLPASNLAEVRHMATTPGPVIDVPIVTHQCFGAPDSCPICERELIERMGL